MLFARTAKESGSRLIVADVLVARARAERMAWMGFMVLLLDEGGCTVEVAWSRLVICEGAEVETHRKWTGMHADEACDNTLDLCNCLIWHVFQQRAMHL